MEGVLTGISPESPPRPSTPSSQTKFQHFQAPKTPPRTSQNDQKWDLLKDEIHYRYIVENKSLPVTRNEISEAYGFHMSTRSWKMKLKEWGYEKHLSEEAMKIILAKVAKRKAEEGKGTEFIHNGLLIPDSKIENFKKRKRTDEIADFSQYANASTPAKVILVTPMNSIQGSIGSKDSTRASNSGSQKDELEASIRECAASEATTPILSRQPAAVHFLAGLAPILEDSLRQQETEGVSSLDEAAKLEILGDTLRRDSEKISMAVESYLSAYVQYRELHHSESALRCLLAAGHFHDVYHQFTGYDASIPNLAVVEVVKMIVADLIQVTGRGHLFRARDAPTEVANNFEERFENEVYYSLYRIIQLLGIRLGETGEDQDPLCLAANPPRLLLHIYKRLHQLPQQFSDLGATNTGILIQRVLNDI